MRQNNNTKQYPKDSYNRFEMKFGTWKLPSDLGLFLSKIKRILCMNSQSFVKKYFSWAPLVV